MSKNPKLKEQEQEEIKRYARERFNEQVIQDCLPSDEALPASGGRSAPTALKRGYPKKYKLNAVNLDTGELLPQEKCVTVHDYRFANGGELQLHVEPTGETRLFWKTSPDKIRELQQLGMTRSQALTSKLIEKLGEYNQVILQRKVEGGFTSGEREAQKQVMVRRAMGRLAHLRKLERWLNEEPGYQSNLSLRNFIQNIQRDVVFEKTASNASPSSKSKSSRQAKGALGAIEFRQEAKISHEKQRFDELFGKLNTLAETADLDALTIDKQKAWVAKEVQWRLERFIRRETNRVLADLEEDNEIRSIDRVNRGELFTIVRQAMKINDEYQFDQHRKLTDDHFTEYKDDKPVLLSSVHHTNGSAKELNKLVTSICKVEGLLTSEELLENSVSFTRTKKDKESSSDKSEGSNTVTESVIANQLYKTQATAFHYRNFFLFKKGFPYKKSKKNFGRFLLRTFLIAPANFFTSLFNYNIFDTIDKKSSGKQAHALAYERVERDSILRKMQDKIGNTNRAFSTHLAQSAKRVVAGIGITLWRGFSSIFIAAWAELKKFQTDFYEGHPMVLFNHTKKQVEQEKKLLERELAQYQRDLNQYSNASLISKFGSCFADAGIKDANQFLNQYLRTGSEQGRNQYQNLPSEGGMLRVLKSRLKDFIRIQNKLNRLMDSQASLLEETFEDCETTKEKNNTALRILHETQFQRFIQEVGEYLEAAAPIEEAELKRINSNFTDGASPTGKLIKFATPAEPLQAYWPSEPMTSFMDASLDVLGTVRDELYEYHPVIGSVATFGASLGAMAIYSPVAAKTLLLNMHVRPEHADAYIAFMQKAGGLLSGGGVHSKAITSATVQANLFALSTNIFESGFNSWALRLAGNAVETPQETLVHVGMAFAIGLLLSQLPQVGAAIVGRFGHVPFLSMTMAGGKVGRMFSRLTHDKHTTTNPLENAGSALGRIVPTILRCLATPITWSARPWLDLGKQLARGAGVIGFNITRVSLFAAQTVKTLIRLPIELFTRTVGRVIDLIVGAVAPVPTTQAGEKTNLYLAPSIRMKKFLNHTVGDRAGRFVRNYTERQIRRAYNTVLTKPESAQEHFESTMSSTGDILNQVSRAGGGSLDTLVDGLQAETDDLVQDLDAAKLSSEQAASTFSAVRSIQAAHGVASNLVTLLEKQQLVARRKQAFSR